VPKQNRKQAAQLASELKAAGLSPQKLSGIFGASASSVRAWTTGARRCPKWLAPALRLYAMLPPGARAKALGIVCAPGNGIEKPAKQQISNQNNRHPFARIEDL